MDIVFTIFFIIALIACVIIIVDYMIFRQKITLLREGMTGIQIQNITGKKLIIFSVENNGTVYRARISSMLTIFSYRLTFVDGKLISWQRGK